eukprot:Skav200177  [mRNA]  locus=scaffold1159:307631:311396:- [translate_table: standard]
MGSGPTRWLWELQADLRWLQGLVPVDLRLPTEEHWDWSTLLATFAHVPRWKQLINLATKKYLAQEQLAFEVDSLHHQAYVALREAGFHFAPEDEETDQPAPLPTGQFPCDHCDRICPTKQSLAAHVYKQHQTHSIEWQYVQSSVCPGCLRNFWTSRRLQQHLRYRRNRCFDKVHGTREQVEGVSVSLDPAFKHLKRLQVYRDVHGPLRPTPAQRHRAVLQGKIVVHLWDFPLNHALQPVDHARLVELDTRLTPLVRHFQHAEDPDLCVLHSQCLACLQDLFDQDSVAASAFMDWLWGHRLEGDHFPMAALTALALDLGHWRPFQQLREWQEELELVEDEPTFPVVGRKAAQGYVDRRHFLPGRFGDLADAEAHRRQWTLRYEARVQPDLAASYRLVVHLFSGRRRQGDFQHFAEIMLKDVPGYMIISLDTAVSARMNIFEEATWSFLWAAAREGHIAALLMGPPCESWSEVRFMQLLTSNGQLRRGPRPLRSFDRLWGLPLLSLREYAQLHLGNQLLLRGLWLGIMTRFRQGKVIVEHPRAPEDLDRPTIWRSAIIEHLCATSMFSQHTVLQYRYGAKGVKPTTLLCGGVCLSRLNSWARDDFVKPSTALVGVDQSGRFRTFVAKEYPMLLNAAFAHSMLFDSRFVPDPSAAQPEWALLAKDFELAARQTRKWPRAIRNHTKRKNEVYLAWPKAGNAADGPEDEQPSQLGLHQGWLPAADAHRRTSD